jgi:protein-L-isoaspartate(D-aspartate) O-methyltransferase
MDRFETARKAMVEGQVRTGDVTRRALTEAMARIPRERFVARGLRDLAYAELQLELAPGRRMLDPRSFAKMVQAAEIDRDDLVLDVGCLTGYSAAVISRLSGAVLALEQDEALAGQARDRLSELGFDTVIVETGALAEGAPGSAPFDAIVVEGAVEKRPDALLDQLKDGGRLVAIHREGPYGRCRVWTRTGAQASHRVAFDADAPVLPGFDVAPAFTF